MRAPSRLSPPRPTRPRSTRRCPPRPIASQDECVHVASMIVGNVNHRNWGGLAADGSFQIAAADADAQKAAGGAAPGPVRRAPRGAEAAQWPCLRPGRPLHRRRRPGRDEPEPRAQLSRSLDLNLGPGPEDWQHCLPFPMILPRQHGQALPRMSVTLLGEHSVLLTQAQLANWVRKQASSIPTRRSDCDTLDSRLCRLHAAIPFPELFRHIWPPVAPVMAAML